MNREEAIKLLKEKVKRENLLKHMLAVEAIMKRLAEHLGAGVEKWALTGLLHDIDFDETKDEPERHGLVGAKILKKELKDEIGDDVIRAIKSHNFEHTGVMPERKLEHALIAADSISGLIVAAALIMPSKKLDAIEAENVGNRFEEKDFARNCSRERILYCEKLGLKKEEFFEIALDALKEISDELGL